MSNRYPDEDKTQRVTIENDKEVCSAEVEAGRKPAQSSLLLRALEPRIMLDAAALATGLDLADDGDSGAADQAPTVDGDSSESSDLLLESLAQYEAPTNHRSVVFIDPLVEGQTGLLEDIGATSDVVVLRANQDGVSQIAEYLEGRRDVEAIHIISHGGDGELKLGDGQLNSETLETYRESLTAIGNALSADADILLYGCDVAASQRGLDFIGALAEATGADVAASDDDTGNAALGGDWDLEQQTGAIEAELAVGTETQASYTHLLAPPTAANNTVTTNEDTTHVFTSADFNYSDPDTDPMVSIKITSLETVGALKLDGADVTLDQVITKADIDANKLTFIPVGDANGSAYDSFAFSVNDGALDSLASYTMTVDVTAVNDAPVFTSLDGSPTHTENGDPVVLDIDVTLLDPDLNAAGNYNGATLTLGRAGGADASDELHLDGGQGHFSVGANQLLLNGMVFATYSTTNGTLVVNFIGDVGGATTDVTPELFNDVLQHITYATSADTPDAEVTLAWTFDDGNDGTQGSGGAKQVSGTTTVTIEATDDVPVLDVTAGNHYEGDNWWHIFPDTTFTDPDGGNIPWVSIEVIGANQDDLLQVTEQHGITQNYDSGTSTLTLTGLATAAQYQDLLQTLQFYNSAGGGWSLSFSFRSAFNSAPILLSTDNSPTFTENGSPVVLAPDIIPYDRDLYEDDDYGGASLTIQRFGGAESEDAFLLSGTPIGASTITIGLPSGGITLSASDGVFTMNFLAGTSRAYTTYLARLIQYENTSDAPPSAVVLEWNFNDGNTGEQGIGDGLYTTAQTTVNIISVNDNPEGSDNTIVFEEDGSHTFTAADFGYSDYEGDPFVSVRITSLESAGSLTWNNGSSDVAVTLNQVITKADIDAGKLKFTPQENANGTAYDNFEFVVRDASEDSLSSYTMTLDVTPVNDLPTAADGTVTIDEDTTYTFSTTDFSYSDVETATLASIKITTLETVGALKLDGVDVTLNQVITKADIDANKLTFTPVAEANGAAYDSFGFEVNDGANDSAAAYTLTVDVTAVDDAPTSADKTITLDEDGSHTFLLTDFAYSDVEGQAMASIKVTSLEGVGSLTWNNGSSDLAVTENQVITKADIEAGKLIFTPVANGSGTAYDSFGFSVNDGAVDSTAYTMTLDVTAFNDLPTAADGTVTTDEDTIYTFTAADFGYDDIESDPLASVKITTLETVGALKLNGADVTLNQVITKADIDANKLTFTPVAEANGAAYDSFGFEVNDGTGDSAAAYTLTVDVTAVDDAPTSADKTITLDEDGSHTFILTDFAYSDVEGQSMASIKVTSLESVGSLTWNNGSSDVAVTGNQVITKADIEAGKLIFTPVADGNGAPYDSFAFSVNDGALDSTAYTMTLDVTALNDLPTAADGTITLDEDTTYTFSAADFGYDDVDADPLASIEITTLNGVGRLTLEGVDVTLNQVIDRADIDTGKLRFAPVAEAFGAAYDSFGFSVNDGTGDSTAAYTLTMDVTAISDYAPSAADNTVTIDEEGSHIFSAADFGYVDLDPDPMVSVKISTLETAGALTLDGANVTLDQVISKADIDAGKLIFTPVAGANGAAYDSFGFKVNDGSVDSGAYTLTVDVTAINDAPLFSGLNGAPSHTEDSSAVVLDANVTLFDFELNAANSYNGATLTLARNGGADGGDLFAHSGNLSALTEGGNLVLNSTTVGTVTTNSGGTLVLTFNAAATQAVVNAVMRSITYATGDDTPPASVTIDWSFSDENGGSQGTGGALSDSGSTTVDITTKNDAPILNFPDDPPVLTRNEDTNPTTAVKTFMSGVTISNTDGDSNQWVAIIGFDNTNGSWQYYHWGVASWKNMDHQANTGIVVDTENDARLLNKNDYIRFVPNTNFIGTATFQYRAWDETNKSSWAGRVRWGTANTTTNGGSTAYSSAVGTGTTIIRAVNDAPVLDNTETPAFGAISEDISSGGNGGKSVAALLVDGSISDVDGVAVEAMAVTAVDNTNGLWQFSLDSGENWTDFSATSGSSVDLSTASRLLGGSDLVRFAPDANYNGSATITFRAWDESSGTAGDTADTSTNGGTTAFSTATDTASITITAVNDAPTGDDKTITLDEDITHTFTAADFGYSDVESTAMASIRITRLESAGDLQLSGADVTLGQAVSGADIVAGNLKFTPATDAFGTAYDSFGFSVSDGVLDSVEGYTITFDVTSVNDAPTSSNAAVTMPEDGIYTFSADDFLFSDLDGGTLTGIRISTLESAGDLELNGSDVTSDQVIAVADIANLTFTPAASATGGPYATFSFKVNDGTSDSIAYTLGINVDSSMDAPVLDSGATPQFGAINEDVSASANSGMSVATLLVDGSITDPDGTAVEAMAVTAVDNTNGLWQYSLDNGSNWSDFSATTGASVDLSTTSRLLSGSHLIRFNSNADYNGNAAITFRAWDRSSGAAGDTADSSVNGGSTAFSTASDTASIIIAAVDDAPAGEDKTVTMDEDGIYTFAAADFGYSDAEEAAMASIKVTTLETAGSLELNGSAVTLNQVIDKADIDSDLLKFTPAGNANGTGYDSFTFSVNDGTYDSAASYTLTVDVTAVNDDLSGAVTITGTPTEGETLTAANTLADEDGLGTIGYQWKADGVDISGATASTYTLLQSEVGKAITVVAAYTDDQGTAESLASSATSAVVNVNDAPTGSVTITGTATEDQELTAANTLADEDVLGTISYQWQADGVDISGATVSTYTLTQSEVGKAITVVASYTDGESTAESVASSATAAVANVNDDPTGTVTISGTAAEDQILTGANTLADGDVLGTISYQWKADAVDITGATASTYTLTQSEVGKVITLVASYTDGEGTAESVTSSATSAVANVNDDPTGTVSISGTPTEGETLTASNFRLLADEDGLGTLGYQWKADGVDIIGATALTYTLTQSEVGKAITVVVGYTDDQGTEEGVTSSATAAVANVADAPTGTVTISGTVTEDQTLTAANTLADEDGLGTISYQWQRDGVDIAAATAATYTLGDTDVGAAITVVASYTDGQGASHSVTSSATTAVVNINDAPTAANSSVTTDEDTTYTFSAADFGYGDIENSPLASIEITSLETVGALKLNGADVTLNQVITRADIDADRLQFIPAVDGNGAGHDSFGFTVNDGTDDSAAAYTMTVDVTATNDDPAGTLTISGTPTEDATLTAVNALSDADGLGAFSYQWKADGANISGATATTYTLTQAEVGKVITVVAAYSDGGGTSESVASAATSAVANVNDAATGTVTISGTAAEEQILTASNNLTDGDVLGSISYQWQADGADISGATASTYTLTQSEVGKAVTAVASYTDGQGTLESVTSSATVAVTNVSHAVTGSVTISGTAAEDQTLTAANTLADEDGLGTIGYQWRADGVDITGATASTYTLTQSEVGKAISVVASYTDDESNLESVASSATAAVANVNDLPVGTVNVVGTPMKDQELIASGSISDEDGVGTLSYQWRADGVDISGATSSGYTLTQDEVGKAITVVTSYTDGEGTVDSLTSSATSAVRNLNYDPTGEVTISGTPAEDQLLTASNTLADQNGLGTISYQWKADGINIQGATSATYTLTQSDVGKAITVYASYTDLEGSQESVSSAATAVIANVNDDPTGTVTITGTAAQDATLTAANGLSDADGLGAVSYQWKADGVDIPGATASTYTLTQSEVGKAITIAVSYTDLKGTSESVTSSATSAVVNVNDAPAGTLTISGTPAEDQTLTVNNTLTDEDGLGTLSYQWKADGVDISGATTARYTLTQADVGKAITVVASYTDGKGASESITSQATSSVTNVADAPTGTVTISGTPTEDQTLTANNTLADGDGLGTVSYQWQRDGVDISGATGATYTLGDEDAGAAITLVATYIDGEGATETISSSATPAVTNVADTPTGGIAISGTATEDQTLTAVNTLADGDGLGTMSYQWRRDGVDITGATASTYTLGNDDTGAQITLVASYTDGQGTAETVTSSATSAVVNVPDAPSGGIAINGSATEGHTLTAVNTLADGDGLGAISYQWQRDDVDIAGATDATYTLTDADTGAAIKLVASYTDGQGNSESVISSATAAVVNVNNPVSGGIAISGTVREDQTLTAVNTLADEDGLGTVSYQWQRDGVAISGATEATYTLGNADAGAAITLVASYTDGQGTAETITSSATPTVVNVNDATTGSVTISGTAAEDQVLTAVNTLADGDGLGTISYQWQRDGADISGATDATYTLGDEDAGAEITLVASYTDGQGTEETTTSSATATVVNVPDTPTGSIVINGSAAEGQTLTVVNTLADGDGLGTVSYQWQRDGVDISGATATLYTLGDADVGAAMTVTASYTDGSGDAESITSSATAAVANVDDPTARAVTISGTAIEDQTLTAHNTLDDGSSLATADYQWRRNGVDISGATADSYTLGDADTDAVITVVASYTDGGGDAQSVASKATAAVVNVNDPTTGGVTISGTLTEDQTLTANNTLADADGLGTVSYQWQRDGVDISGATSAAYTLDDADAGAAITLVASYTDGQGTVETIPSSTTSAVVNVPDTPTGSIAISGTATEGETLTAVNTLADGDGLGTVSYQWQRDGADIPSASLATYTLTEADTGAAITLVASYTDGQGNAESITSDATAAVVNTNDSATGSVSITGTATEDYTLTVTNTLADGDGLGSISYQWQRDGVDISGATEATYTLGDDDAGAEITAVASYTDGNGTVESITSSPTSAVVNVADEPAGSITISGTAAEDQTLTAVSTLTDGDGLGTISYQWQRDGADISGATEATYTLGDEDAGAAVTVVASYTDGSGDSESVTSSATAAVVNVPDAPTGVISISGTATEGATLTAVNTLADGDGLGTISYQWQRDGQDISAATESTYTLGDDDAGAAITVLASYTDGSGNSETVTSSATAAVTNVNDAATGTVTISGTVAEDQTLTAQHTLADGDGLGAVSYQWQRDGVAISGATGASYTLDDADAGAEITVAASYTDGNGTTETISSSATTAVTNVNDPTTGTLAISGTVAEDQTLTAVNTLADGDGLGTVSYQWQRDGVDISGATESTYTLGNEDAGAAITLVAEYTDGNGTSETITSSATAAVTNVNDPTTGSITISGTVAEDQTLTAVNTLADGDGLGTVTYQWQRDGVDISGATEATYTLDDADAGAAITLAAEYTDGNGTTETITSSATAAVTNVNDPVGGSIAISGTPAAGQTLTVVNTLTDGDGLGTVSYQWQRDGAEISGATESTYTLTGDDTGSAVTVVASYTDDNGTSESITSTPTADIGTVNNPATGSVTISGTVEEDQTLTANNTLADVDGLGTVTYQWQRDGADISGATGSTYTLGDDDTGAAITLVATFTDGNGTVETISSSATAAVVNVNDLPGGMDATITPNEDTEYTFTAADFGYSDVEGEALASIEIKSLESVGSLELDGIDVALNQVITKADIDAGKLKFTPAANEHGAAYDSFRFTVNDGTDSSNDRYTMTLDVNSVNDPLTGAIAITGNATEDQTLTAVNTLADADGLGTVSYQWQRDGVDISGATEATYTLGDEDAAAAITLVASYTDGDGTVESTTSSATPEIININDPVGGSVAIVGKVMEGQTLTAVSTLSDGDGLGAISYQWKRDGADISGATAATYTLGDDDAGAAISLVASYTDGHGNTEYFASSSTAAVDNVNDPTTGGVTISGTATEGQTLTAANTLADGDGLGTIGYQWQRDGVDIDGAILSTYTLGDDDVGAAITLVASYTDDNGTTESITSDATAAIANVNDSTTGSVTISGTVTEGQTLIATNTLADGDGLGTVSYQWQRDGVDISGATGATYTLGDEDATTEITVVASYTDGSGSSETVASSATAAVVNVNDPTTGTLAISGTVAENQTLTAVNTLADGDGLGTVSYQWQRDGVDISGATEAAYTLGDADVGAAITLEASYTDGNGTSETVTSSATAAVTNVNDPTTGTIAISGTVTEDQTLTAVNTLADGDGLGTVSYQWQRDGVDITGATESTYTLGNDDAGTAITLVASYTDGEGTSETITSSATPAVVNVSDPTTGGISLIGRPLEDQTLTVIDTLADGDGIGARDYQWQRDGVDISGATATTYTLDDDDAGAEITLVASYLNSQGNTESVTSSATAAVTNANDQVGGGITINGTATEGNTLAVSNTLSDGDGLGTVSYQWQRDGVDIAGATADTYTLISADAGKNMSVVAIYSDGYGTAESAISSGVDVAAGILSTSASATDDSVVQDLPATEGEAETGIETALLYNPTSTNFAAEYQSESSTYTLNERLNGLLDQDSNTSIVTLAEVDNRFEIETISIPAIETSSGKLFTVSQYLFASLDQAAIAGGGNGDGVLTYQTTMRDGTLVPVRGEGVVSLTAMMPDGEDIPEWIIFNEETGSFLITQPPGGGVDLTFQINAVHSNGVNISASVHVTTDLEQNVVIDMVMDNASNAEADAQGEPQQEQEPTAQLDVESTEAVEVGGGTPALFDLLAREGSKGFHAEQAANLEMFAKWQRVG